MITVHNVDFTAVFAFSDMIAWETMYTLNEYGKQVPRDAAIVGFDNIQSKWAFPAPLTTVSTSKSKMSLRALDILLKRINSSVEYGYIKDILDTQIVVRGST